MFISPQASPLDLETAVFAPQGCLSGHAWCVLCVSPFLCVLIAYLPNNILDEDTPLMTPFSRKHLFKGPIPKDRHILSIGFYDFDIPILGDMIQYKTDIELFLVF